MDKLEQVGWESKIRGEKERIGDIEEVNRKKRRSNNGVKK